MSQFDNLLDKKEKKKSAFDSIEIDMKAVDKKIEEKKIVKKEVDHESIDQVIQKNGSRHNDEEDLDDEDSDDDVEDQDPDEDPRRKKIRRRPPPQRRPGLLGRWRDKSKKKIQSQKHKKHRPKHKRDPRQKQARPLHKEGEGEGFTKEEQHRIQTKFAHDYKLTKKERKKLRFKEKQPDYQKLIITIFTISIFFFFLLFQYNPGNEALTTIMLLIGCVLFLPIGMIVGWMVMDPFMRCKIMRKMTKRNWGVINFVAKGKKIISRIKNLDNDLIWIKNKCWAVTKEGIFELDKNGDRIVDEEKNEIDTDSIITITETVPVMFIDMNSMQPLTFEYEGREGISPAELGSSLKGWVDNQLAKVMFLKKTMDTYFLIVIVCALVSAFYGYTNNSTLQDMEVELQSLKQMIANLQALTP